MQTLIGRLQLETRANISAAQLIANRWQAWSRRLASMQLCAPHLRRCIPYKKKLDGEIVPMESEPADFERVLTYHAITAHAIVGLLTCMLSVHRRHGGLKDEASKGRVKDNLMLFIEQLPVKTYLMRINIDARPFRVGKMCLGNNPVPPCLILHCCSAEQLSSLNHAAAVSHGWTLFPIKKVAGSWRGGYACQQQYHSNTHSQLISNSPLECNKQSHSELLSNMYHTQASNVDNYYQFSSFHDTAASITKDFLRSSYSDAPHSKFLSNMYHAQTLNVHNYYQISSFHDTAASIREDV